MNQERIFTVLVAPHISEKTANVSEAHNQVVFKVSVDATKLEVKKAVEQLFEVKVKSVATLNVKGKVKRNRYGSVRKASWKKAYVTLEAGQDIDFTLGA
ncbi:MAG: 50S ribosomal protein L23 [Pseudomonadales bacterium]